jgi:hypothetical protein
MASNISCPPTPSPHATSLDSTYSRDSHTSTHTFTLQISCISSADLRPRQFQVPFWELVMAYPYCSSIYAVVYFETFPADTRMLMQYPDVCVCVHKYIVYLSLV